MVEGLHRNTKGWVAMPNRMNFWKISKRPLTPPSSFRENYIAIFFRKTSEKSPFLRFKICIRFFWIENDRPLPPANSSDLVAWPVPYKGNLFDECIISCLVARLDFNFFRPLRPRSTLFISTRSMVIWRTPCVRFLHLSCNQTTIHDYWHWRTKYMILNLLTRRMAWLSLPSL